ncbi:ATP-binding cassette domain-containing protein [Pseudonocardia sp. TRM90224]|uniref:ATP-binding cassette domain-containing protein n=1 Tax=Pseudonocardia sp. TRM90224 TaxID=2812678 RepID=UPI001E4E22C7|nr:ABC transporter ATP-binding protein [Pseudonocardia sp. TRM90224]
MTDGTGVAVRADRLGKRYGARWALRDCSFELPAGRTAALVGPNGAGKTTLLMIAAGLLRPTAGTAEVTGSVGFLAQSKALYRTFRVAEMLRLTGRLEAAERWDGAYASRLVDEAGIDTERRVGRLTPGERARVAVALALGRRPDLLLLDEPLAELDPLARRQVMGMVLAEASGAGTTVLMSSHVIADVEEACDHLVLLRGGRVRVAGPVDALLDQHRLLTGPAGGAGIPAEAVVLASTAGRQTTALVRAAALPSPPAKSTSGLASARPGLEDLVMAYLQDANDGGAA